MSPPGPFRCGSQTCSMNPAAAAASNALPPRSSTPMATLDASQCVLATIPKLPISSGRVVKPAISVSGSGADLERRGQPAQAGDHAQGRDPAGAGVLRRHVLDLHVEP